MEREGNKQKVHVEEAKKGRKGKMTGTDKDAEKEWRR